MGGAARVKSVLNLLGRTRFRGYTAFGQKYKPMLQVLDELRRREIQPEKLKVLEVFGRDGVDHTMTYADGVKSLEVWEVDKNLRCQLEKNLPDAVIRIVDSYEEIETTTTKYDLIVLDNPIGIYNNHCDHFDFFPDPLFRVTSDDSLFVINVIPDIDPATLKIFPNLDEKYLEERADFYNIDDPMHISFDQMIDTYRRFIEINDYQLLWTFRIERSKVYYLAFRIERLSPCVKMPETTMTSPHRIPWPPDAETVVPHVAAKTNSTRPWKTE